MAVVWDQFDNTSPVFVDNNATCFTDGIKLLALGLPADMKGVAYRETHELLLNAVPVLKKVGNRVYYDFTIPRDTDVITDIQVEGVDAIDVCANTKSMPLTNDMVIALTASQYTQWTLRLWWNERPAMGDQVVITYQVRLYESEKRRILATYALQTSTHSYYCGVAEPLQQP